MLCFHDLRSGVARYSQAVLLASFLLLHLSAWPQEVTPNLVIQWNNAALQGVRDSKLGPPMVARALAIVHTCIYDAWAAYDDEAVATRPGPGREHRFRHRRRQEAAVEEAISYAAYRAAVDLFPADQDKVFDPLMQA